MTMSSYITGLLQGDWNNEFQYVEDNRNPAAVYIGRAKKRIGHRERGWQIARVSFVDDVSTLEFASNGTFNHRWNQRRQLFGPYDASGKAGNGENIITWSNISSAVGYSLYWSTTVGVNKTDNFTKITNVTSPYTHAGAIDGTRYYYRILAATANGQTLLGNETCALTGTGVDAYSFYLGGLNQYIAFDNPSNFHFASAGSDLPFTGFGWVNMKISDKFKILSKGAINNREYTFGTEGTDRLTLDMFGATGEDNRIERYSNEDLEGDINAWLWLGFTYNGSGSADGITLYRNGKTLASHAETHGLYTCMNDSAEALEMGRINDSSYAAGYFDEFIVFSGCLTPEEMQEGFSCKKTTALAQHTRYDDAIGYWRMGDDALDDGTATTGNIQDQKGTNHGTPYNTVAGNIQGNVP